MHPLRRCGGSCEAHCQVHALESGEKRGEPKAGDFGGQHDNEYTLRGMMWADNFWLFIDNREKLICMVNDIIEELLDLDMERNPESLWWTSTFQDENMRTLRVGVRDRAWDLLLCEVFDVLGYRFHRNGKGFQGVERSMCKALRSWWRDKYITMTTKCKRVHSHVYSTVLNGSINWPWSGAVINKVRAWESQILRLTFRPRKMPDESWVTNKIRTSRFVRICWRKMGLPLLSHKIADKIWTTMTCAVFDGDVPVMLALRSLLGLRTTAWWRSRSSWGMAWDSNDVQRWKHKVQWDTPMARWAGEANDWIELMTQTRPQKEDVIWNLLESMKQPVD